MDDFLETALDRFRDSISKGDHDADRVLEAIICAAWRDLMAAPPAEIELTGEPSTPSLQFVWTTPGCSAASFPSPSLPPSRSPLLVVGVAWDRSAHATASELDHLIANVPAYLAPDPPYDGGSAAACQQRLVAVFCRSTHARALPNLDTQDDQLCVGGQIRRQRSVLDPALSASRLQQDAARLQLTATH